MQRSDANAASGFGSSRILQVITLLAIVGMSIAGYLVYVHYNMDALVCTTGGCEVVQNSEFSTVFGIPIAAGGLLMFGSVLTLALMRLRGVGPFDFSTATMIAWGMLFASLLYYGYLTYVELYVLDAVCQWCVASSIVALGLFALESVLLVRDFRAE